MHICPFSSPHALPDATTVRTSLVLTGGTLTFSVLANTAKVYGREIALGAPATPTQNRSPEPA